MGMWLLQECRRAWDDVAYDELHRLAARRDGESALFDPDDEGLLAPGDMPARIAAACERSASRAARAAARSCARSSSRSPASTAGCSSGSRASPGASVRRIHVVGGGARNALLCRLTADVCGREVLAGPVEATALGNVLVQARAAGELGSLADLRAVAAASAEPDVVRAAPTATRRGTYRRFLDVTGLTPTA